MKLFQSERRLNKELSQILRSAKDKILSFEQKVLRDEQDFLVYLDSELEVEGGIFEHYQIRDGSEVVLRI